MLYSDIDEVLMHNDADMHAAEAHGMATGMLCINAHIDADQWVQELFPPEHNIDSDAYTLIINLFEKTRELLVSDSFEFDLFLPDDEELLEVQTEALCFWCQGFLFGVGYGHSSATWPGNSGEILKDIVEFTKLDVHSHDEDDEQALVEIIEYLRAAVLLLRDDLRGDSEQTH